MTRYTTLVHASEVHEHLDDPSWIVFDCRHDLVDTEVGRRAYAQAHIPGAHFLHLDQDLSSPKTGTNGRHPLPDAAAFCQRLAGLGMANDKQAVAYDASGGFYAARLWWMLRWVGHTRVAVIDGGWDAWLASGYTASSAAPAVRVADFECRKGDLPVAAAYVAQHLDTLDFLLLDARSPDRFRGENETLDPVGGHIPGAMNRFFKNNLDTRGRFKTPAELKKDYFQALGDRRPSEVVHLCGSGVTACHNLLAMEIAGLDGSRLYPGSWSEWCADLGRPVARG